MSITKNYHYTKGLIFPVCCDELSVVADFIHGVLCFLEVPIFRKGPTYI